MGIFRSTDPTVWDDTDGIIINESAPAPNVAGVAANIAILVGVTQRGPSSMTDVGSIGEFYELFGKDDTKGVNISLKNKKFGRLKIIRVIASDAALATKAFQSSTTDRITFSAKQGKGAYGNNLQVKIENGSTTGKKYTIHDNNSGAVLPDEIYDNIAIASITSDTFANSKLITAVVNSSVAEPTNCSFTNLATGLDGTVADTDYQTSIALAEVENAGNFIFLDAYNSTRNGYLKTHVANTQDKMAVVCGAEGDSVSTATADAANFRDTDGRIIYAYPWVQTTIGGVPTFVNPASFLVSILSQTSPHIDPAYVKNADFLAGITDLKLALTRTNYISLMAAGICAFERTRVGLYKPKSGVTTQISDTSKLTILRRRMADFLSVSAAEFLENYQNAPNSKQNRTLVKGAFVAFVDSLERDGILPKDSDVKTGKAKLIDTESLNTDASIAAGFFKILWKQRIFSSMRFIVLQAEIGESVVVTEQAA
jgi:hypothetical protein